MRLIAAMLAALWSVALAHEAGERKAPAEIRVEDLKQHAELMRKHPHMEHEEAHMAHVSPGKSGEIAWQFTRAGEFYFACLIPGHFEAGMVGRISVIP